MFASRPRPSPDTASVRVPAGPKLQSMPGRDMTPCLDDTETLLFYFDESDHGGLQTPLPDGDAVEHEFSLDHMFEAKRQASRSSSPAGSGHSAPSSYTAQTMLVDDGCLLSGYDSRSPWPSPDEFSNDLERSVSSSAISIRGRHEDCSEYSTNSDGTFLGPSSCELPVILQQTESSSCPSDCCLDDLLSRRAPACSGPYGSWSSPRDGRVNPSGSSKWTHKVHKDQLGAKGRRKRRSQVCTDLEQQLAKLDLDLSELSRNSSLANSCSASRSSSPLPIFPGASSLPSSFFANEVDHMQS